MQVVINLIVKSKKYGENDQIEDSTSIINFIGTVNDYWEEDEVETTFGIGFVKSFCDFYPAFRHNTSVALNKVIGNMMITVVNVVVTMNNCISQHDRQECKPKVDTLTVFDLDKLIDNVRGVVKRTLYFEPSIEYFAIH